MKMQHFLSLRNLKKPASLCISALFIISILSILSLSAVQAATVTNFGKTTVGTQNDWNTGPAWRYQMVASKFTATSDLVSLNMASISVYCKSVNSGTFHGKLAIYSDNSGVPGSLLVSGSEFTFTNTAAWKISSISYNLKGNTNYWLAFFSDGYFYNYETTGTTNQEAFYETTTAFYPNFPASFNPSGYADIAMSIYATVTTPPPSSSQSPTPTTTPTAAPTPSSTPSPTFTPTPTPAPTTTPTSSTFGNTAIGTITDNNDANAQSISYFTCTTTGSITDIIAYIAGTTSGKAITALYAVNGGSASTLLRQSNSVNIGTTFSWVDFQLPSTYTVTAGTTYGLAIMGNVQVNFMEASGAGQRDHNAVSSYANGFANPFGSIWGKDNTGAMSIYAAGTSSPNPTATPTLTPTPTATPKPTTTPTPTITPTPTSTPKPTTTPTPTQSPTQKASASPNSEPLSAFYPSLYAGQSSVDTTVVHNGNPSIKLHTNSVWSEVDGAWVSVKAGDHIVFSCWVKTSTGPNSNPPYNGARIGIDYYVAGGIARYSNGDSPGLPTATQNVKSQPTNFRSSWGTDWTLLTWDVYVPTEYYSWHEHNGSNVAISPTQIDSLVVWFDVRESSDNAYAWFSEPTLYINP